FCLGEARTFPAARRLAGEGTDGLDGIGDRLLLVVDLVHWLLDVPMADEIPSGFQGSAAGGFIDGDCRAVHRKTRLKTAGVQRFEETPKADAHAVFMPGPVRNVRQKRLPHWRRK